MSLFKYFFISVRTHENLFYILGYNTIIIYFMRQIFLPWPLVFFQLASILDRFVSTQCVCVCVCVCVCILLPYFQALIRCSKIILYSPYSSVRITHSPRIPGSFFRNQGLGQKCFSIATEVPLLLQYPS